MTLLVEELAGDGPTFTSREPARAPVRLDCVSNTTCVTRVVPRRSSGFFDLSKGRYDFHSLKDVVFDFLAGLRFFDFLALKSSCSAAANFRLWPAPPVLARPAEIAVVVEV